MHLSSTCPLPLIFAYESEKSLCGTVEIIDIEDIEAEVAASGEVKFCRCWKSAKFPFCDGSHDGHNLQTGDNTGPIVLLPDAKM